MIFSTVHRCKGMEYDQVSLLHDFINEDKIKRNIKDGENLTEAEINRLAEELNILYVAATRAKSKLIIPAEINPLKSIELAAAPMPISNYHARSYGKSYLDYSDPFDWKTEKPDYTAIRKTSYRKKWTIEEEEELKQLFNDKNSIAKIARRLERGQNAVRYKLSSLGYDPDELDF